ncbi:MAG TPA: hypothetical protein ENI51_07920 [Candidatus Atribacteria bacterium]|nr:hypothetical protein [Candidatus Atribacteria bacterium]
MNQIFNFMEFLKPLILNGTKTMTTRLETPFRLKCNVGDKMYLYTGLRTKNAEKFGEGKVINRWRWNQRILFNAVMIIENKMSPVGVTWNEFSRKEGFNDISELITYFCNKRYKFKNLITYEFELKTK